MGDKTFITSFTIFGLVTFFVMQLILTTFPDYFRVIFNTLMFGIASYSTAKHYIKSRKY